MEEYSVCVLMSTYNGEKFIQRGIEKFLHPATVKQSGPGALGLLNSFVFHILRFEVK